MLGIWKSFILAVQSLTQFISLFEVWD